MKLSLSGAAGLAFAAVFKALKTLRPSGVALTGTAQRLPGSTGSGIPWFDSPGSEPLSARFSRSVGAPSGWPDILGLALRITTETGPADVLLASTPMSRPGLCGLTRSEFFGYRQCPTNSLRLSHPGGWL
ncbi:MAG: hypothetical protein JWN05_2548 [Arthrobacter sp.]|jgi:hypothetical protein|nr:hypothetical protein [Arthrobacter sp.]